MGYVIRIVCPAAGRSNIDDQFLKEYDPEGHDGLGHVEATPNIEEAMIFADSKAAFACYRAVPASRPIRDDGKPNRPLTAFTVTIERRTNHEQGT